MRSIESKAQASMRATVVRPVGLTGLTEREKRTLSLVTKPLFEQGVIDLRYMGIRFLELFKMGMTPMRFVRMEGEVRSHGLWCSDSEFDGIWHWWCLELRESQRVSLIRDSRALGRR